MKCQSCNHAWTNTGIIQHLIDNLIDNPNLRSAWKISQDGSLTIVEHCPCCNTWTWEEHQYISVNDGIAMCVAPITKCSRNLGYMPYAYVISDGEPCIKGDNCLTYAEAKEAAELLKDILQAWRENANLYRMRNNL